MREFRMPSLGADMEYGTLVEWRVAPGATVRRGDIVAEVETQKGVVEVEIFDSGIVEEIMVSEGSRVPVGAVLARIRSGDGAAAPAPVPEPVPEPAAARTTTVPSPAPPVAMPSPPPHPPLGGAPVRASPAARRLAAAHGMDLAALAGTGPDGAVTLADVERARELATRPTAAPPVAGPHRVSPAAQRVAAARGVDLAALTGTGPRGVVTRADVERAADTRGAGVAPQPVAPPAHEEAPPPPAGTAAAERQAAMRRAIAAAMTRSNREIPHYYLSTDIDVSRALHWLEGENLKRPLAERILPAALLLKAVALGLRDAPELNGYWLDGAFRPAPAIHLGIAISLRGGGLIAPAIHDADALPLGALMHALHDLVRRARSGTLRSSELTDATITVTNLGDQGVRTVFGVIYPPQVALVGIGKVSERPWAEHGMVGARAVATATLAADHRASDGHRGALFLVAVDRILQAPERL